MNSVPDFFNAVMLVDSVREHQNHHHQLFFTIVAYLSQCRYGIVSTVLVKEISYTPCRKQTTNLLIYIFSHTCVWTCVCVSYYARACVRMCVNEKDKETDERMWAWCDRGISTHSHKHTHYGTFCSPHCLFPLFLPSLCLFIMLFPALCFHI